MKGRILTEKLIADFSRYLESEEKSENTVQKYLRDVRAFAVYLSGTEITNESVITYKNKLLSENYLSKTKTGVQRMVVSLSSTFISSIFLGDIGSVVNMRHRLRRLLVVFIMVYDKMPVIFLFQC